MKTFRYEFNCVTKTDKQAKTKNSPYLFNIRVKSSLVIKNNSIGIYVGFKEKWVSSRDDYNWYDPVRQQSQPPVLVGWHPSWSHTLRDIRFSFRALPPPFCLRKQNQTTRFRSNCQLRWIPTGPKCQKELYWSLEHLVSFLIGMVQGRFSTNTFTTSRLYLILLMWTCTILLEQKRHHSCAFFPLLLQT